MSTSRIVVEFLQQSTRFGLVAVDVVVGVSLSVGFLTFLRIRSHSLSLLPTPPVRMTLHEQLPCHVGNMSKASGAQLDATVPPRHHHQHAVFIAHVQQLCQSGPGSIFSVVRIVVLENRKGGEADGTIVILHRCCTATMSPGGTNLGESVSVLEQYTGDTIDKQKDKQAQNRD
jgi:hypothetical protein